MGGPIGNCGISLAGENSIVLLVKPNGKCYNAIVHENKTRLSIIAANTGEEETVLDIRELKYFIQIADSASYSTAAEKLYISQPALSKVIQKMEDELGYELFFTYQRQQRLTPDGRQFYAKAVELIKEYDDLLNFPYLEENPYQGQIFLGFPNVAGICYFCSLIAEFSKLYPNIKLRIKESGARRIMADVESGILDIGCAIGPVPEEKFDVRPFVQDISCLVVSCKHPLAKRDSITLPELKDENFVLLGAEFSSHYDICAALRDTGFEPHIAMLSSQWDFIIQLVRLNYGISFLPRSLFQSFSYPDIHLLEVNHLIRYEKLVLITKKGRYLSRNVKCFLDFVQKKMAQQNADWLTSMQCSSGE